MNPIAPCIECGTSIFVGPRDVATFVPAICATCLVWAGGQADEFLIVAGVAYWIDPRDGRDEVGTVVRVRYHRDGVSLTTKRVRVVELPKTLDYISLPDNAALFPPDRTPPPPRA